MDSIYEWYINGEQVSYYFENRAVEDLIEDIDLYEMSLRGLAEYFAEEGIYPAKCPESVLIYLDYDKLAWELGIDYSEFHFKGSTWCARSY